MSEHVPTETEIKLTYMLGVHGNNPTVTASDASGEFDRWLEQHDREVAAKAWSEGQSHGYKDAQGYHAHGDGCGPDFWDCDCENPYDGDSDE